MARLVRAAIEERRVLTLHYKRGGERTVHPHALFVTGTGGTFVDAFQVDGYTSKPETLPAWRQLDLVKIRSVALEPSTFEVARDFNPSATKYANGLLASV